MNNAIDSVTNLIEKVSSPASRSGSAIERVGKMLEADVSPNVIALQMTENSPNDHKYTTQDISAFGNLYQDSKTKVGITAKQTKGLITDNQSFDNKGFALQN